MPLVCFKPQFKVPFDWMTMRRWLIILLLLLLGLLSLAYFFLPAKTVELSQDEIAEIVNNRLPHEIESGFASITVHTADVIFRKDGKVGVEAAFEAKGLTLEGTGEAIVATGIRYDRGRFYLSDLVKENIRFDFSENSKETISDLKSSLMGILQREEEEAAESGDTNKAESVGKVKEYASTKLKMDVEEALDRFLKSIPIYSLNGQGGKLRLAALALEDVTISEGRVTAILSFQVMIARVAGAVFSMLLIAFIFLGPMGLVALISRSK